MDINPICPWCGREMVAVFDPPEDYRYKCLYCRVLSPTRYTPQAAWEAALLLRRKGPLTVKELEARLNTILNPEPDAPALQKPLTWEEIPDRKLIFMELRGIDKPVPSILRQTMDNQAWYTMESGCVFTFDMDELGKRWRPWASEPTEEERAAAPWEGVGDADL